jgi:hypothetical protein
MKKIERSSEKLFLSLDAKERRSRGRARFCRMNFYISMEKSKQKKKKNKSYTAYEA